MGARRSTRRGKDLRNLYLAAARHAADTACAPEPSPVPPSTAAAANPASKNCIAKGGELRIETAGDGSQYGLCLFEDNRQCEEWAMLRGACPVGGIKVTGYVTPQARYCAIRGGDYVVTRMQTAGGEQGTCTLPGEPPEVCARRELQEALRLNNDSVTHLSLAMAWAANDAPDRARRHLEAAIAKDPRMAARAAACEELRRFRDQPGFENLFDSSAEPDEARPSEIEMPAARNTRGS